MAVTHQTVRLSCGSHRAPDEGVCVMELASMLADSPFRDRGDFASTVIGGFLRRYNDGLDDERRQDLYAYAAKVVGTRGDRSVERVRARMCREWARRHAMVSALRRPSRLRLAHGLERCGSDAAEAALTPTTDQRHREALAFLDELIAVHPAAGAPEDVAEARVPDAPPESWPRDCGETFHGGNQRAIP